MKKLVLFISFLSISMSIHAQEIKDVLEKYNDNTVPYITVAELHKNYDDYIIFDTRQRIEYDVSHLPGAIFIGDKEDFHNYLATQPDRSKLVVVYCSIGVRSEDAGKMMLGVKFTDVYNLYGGVFSWKDAGYNVIDVEGNNTNQVHVFSKEWAKYLKTGEKVY